MIEKKKDEIVEDIVSGSSFDKIFYENFEEIIDFMEFQAGTVSVLLEDNLKTFKSTLENATGEIKEIIRVYNSVTECISKKHNETLKYSNYLKAKKIELEEKVADAEKVVEQEQKLLKRKDDLEKLIKELETTKDDPEVKLLKDKILGCVVITGTRFSFAKEYVGGYVLNPITQKSKFFKIDSSKPQQQITKKIQETVEEAAEGDWYDMISNIK